MAKELLIGSDELPFVENVDVFVQEGRDAAQQALERMGGFSGLVEKLPFDRGDANHALVQLCLKMAAALDASNKSMADSLRAEAIKLGDLAREPGTQRKQLELQALIGELRDVWRDLDEPMQTQIKGTGGMTGDLAELLDTIRVLFVLSNPVKADGALDLQSERRGIAAALGRGTYGGKFVIKELSAATRDDLRRALLDDEYDVVHFSGHANSKYLVFVDYDHNPVEVPISAVQELINDHRSAKCVVLNACETAKDLKKPIARLTVAMDDKVDDEVAIEFSRGFYEALAAGKGFEDAYRHGSTAVKMAGHSAELIRLLTTP